MGTGRVENAFGNADDAPTAKDNVASPSLRIDNDYGEKYPRGDGDGPRQLKRRLASLILHFSTFTVQQMFSFFSFLFVVFRKKTTLSNNKQRKVTVPGFVPRFPPLHRV